MLHTTHGVGLKSNQKMVLTPNSHATVTPEDMSLLAGQHCVMQNPRQGKNIGVTWAATGEKPNFFELKVKDVPSRPDQSLT